MDEAFSALLLTLISCFKQILTEKLKHFKDGMRAKNGT